MRVFVCVCVSICNCLFHCPLPNFFGSCLFFFSNYVSDFFFFCVYKLFFPTFFCKYKNGKPNFYSNPRSFSNVADDNCFWESHWRLVLCYDSWGKKSSHSRPSRFEKLLLNQEDEIKRLAKLKRCSRRLDHSSSFQPTLPTTWQIWIDSVTTKTTAFHNRI